jgi:hypothetical protein
MPETGAASPHDDRIGDASVFVHMELSHKDGACSKAIA